MVIREWLGLGIFAGFIVGLICLYLGNNLLIGVISIVTWVILMMGHPKSRTSLRFGYFWISVGILPCMWFVFLMGK